MLALDGVSSAYGRIEVLHGVSLQVRPGEIVSLVGSNGAGKTTLLNAIAGVQPVSAGTVAFQGASLSRTPPWRRVAEGISLVPEGRQIFAPLSVEDNLRLGGYAHQDRASKADLERVYALFPVLAERRRMAGGTLSGGQQQMLAVGRALMARPRLLLLDEPSMGLAPVIADQIFATLVRLRAEGTTLLLVEQNALAALSIADRGYVIETGRIVLEGTGADLLGDDRVRASYLGI
ncbi:MAG: ABC transporter ATP-binding protein [Hyphomicrobiaceae bacterium]